MEPDFDKRKAVLSAIAVIAAAFLLAGGSVPAERGSGGATGYFFAGGTLQPGGDGKDTYLVSGSPNQNFGASTDMDIKGDDNRRVLVEFNLSGIPANAAIKTATLRLYVTATGAPPVAVVNVTRVTTAWTEGTGTGSITHDGATWDNATGSKKWTASGGDFNQKAWATTNVTGAKRYYDWDVTELVRSWNNGTYANYGVMLRTDSANSGITTFASSDNGNASIRPNLTITYVTPPVLTRQDQNTSAPVIGSTVGLSVFWDDNSTLKYAWLATNETGSWRNKTSYGSPVLINAASGWSNFSWQNSSVSGGTIIGWKVYANNSDGLENATGIMAFTMSRAASAASLTLSPAPPVSYGTATTAICSATNPEGTTRLYRNGTDVTPENNTAVRLGAGAYTYVCNVTATQNYMAANATSDYAVSRSSATVLLTLDGQQADLTVTAGDTVNITAVLVSPAGGSMNLTIDGATMNYGPSPLQNLTTFADSGTFLITAGYAGNGNYTAGSTSLYVNVNAMTGTTPRRQQAIVVQPGPDECMRCPYPTDWSTCSDGKQARTAYDCGTATAYRCLPRTEEAACENPAPQASQETQPVPAAQQTTGGGNNPAGGNAPLAAVTGAAGTMPGLAQIAGLAILTGSIGLVWMNRARRRGRPLKRKAG